MVNWIWGADISRVLASVVSNQFEPAEPAAFQVADSGAND